MGWNTGGGGGGGATGGGGVGGGGSGGIGSINGGSGAGGLGVASGGQIGAGLSGIDAPKAGAPAEPRNGIVLSVLDVLLKAGASMVETVMGFVGSLRGAAGRGDGEGEQRGIACGYGPPAPDGKEGLQAVAFGMEQHFDWSQVSAEARQFIKDQEAKGRPFASFWERYVLEPLSGPNTPGQMRKDAHIILGLIQLSSIPLFQQVAAVMDAALFAYEGDYKGVVSSGVNLIPFAKFMASAKAALASQYGCKFATRAMNALQAAGLTQQAYNAVQSGLDAYQALQNGDIKAAYGNAFSATMSAAQGARMLGRLGGACFAAGTPLLTPHGEMPIEEFREGDQLWSGDEREPNAPPQVSKVVEVFRRLSRIWHVHLGNQVIRTTMEHPFYVWDKGWVPAGALQPGDLLHGFDGEYIAVTEVLDTGEIEAVYNLCVAEYHTYFVGGNAWGFAVWAHNADQCQGPNPYGSPGKPDHQEAVRKQGEQFRREYPPKKGYDHESNKSIKGMTGVDRRPDNVVSKDGKFVKGGEVVRPNKDGSLPKRERKKLKDYEKAGLPPFAIDPVPPRD